MRCSSLAAAPDGGLAAALEGAGGGTLFLDDIAGLAPEDQARLLPLVRAGGFRSDLYYGLARTTLAVPGLDARREDIPLLVAEFTRRWQERKQGTAQGFAPDALTLLCEAPWPGHVRQLRHLVEQALGQSVTPLVQALLVRRLMREESEQEMAAFDDARRSFEYRYLVDLLTATSGNVAAAARIAQRNRTEFYKLLARHQLEPSAFK